jgi:hypothetical protein
MLGSFVIFYIDQDSSNTSNLKSILLSPHHHSMLSHLALKISQIVQPDSYLAS